MNLQNVLKNAPWSRLPFQIDRVLLSVIVVLALVFALSARQGWETLVFASQSLWTIAPFMALSIFTAAYVSATGADSLIARVFSGRTIPMIFMAAAFGALSPFCSCGVIPIIAALLAMGVPLAPVMAFWLASPVTDPAMFVVTTGILGFDYAMAKTITAIALGLLGGFGTAWLVRLKMFAHPLKPGIGGKGCAASALTQPKPVIWAFWREPERISKFRREALGTTFFLGKWLALAFVLESLMLAYVPAEWITSLLSGTGIAPIALATLVGVPAYLNGYAALPLMDGLLSQGMAPGAALSFMVAGGVTSIPAAIAVFALVRRPVFLAYILFALAGSFSAGLIFQAVSG